MNLSYWEKKQWFSNIDFTIIGSGIVGLNCALKLKENFPQAKILILEKGVLPQGASTKNAGFACFGSVSEILEDLNSYSEQEVVNLIEKRWNGLKLLRNILTDEAIGFKPYGGYELFLKNESNLYEQCLEKVNYINELLHPIFKSEVYSKQIDRFNFGKTNEYLLFNAFEGQIDTGKMMHALLQKAVSTGIMILNQTKVNSFVDNTNSVTVHLEEFEFKTNKLLIATNGFASKWTNNQVKPARAQVLITEPIPNLDIKGAFHIENGYYYFRNIDDRILFGGGRNLDFENETTTEFGLTSKIQTKLEQLLEEVILPNKQVKIEHRWSGIMGLGSGKNPIIESLSKNVYCGVRLGGMGIAIGSLTGIELADKIR